MTDDLISRQAAIDLFPNDTLEWDTFDGYIAPHAVRRLIEALPSAQSEPEEFEWCNGCKEYDQEKHCCHRWTKVIRKTVDEIKADHVRHGKWIPCAKSGLILTEQMRKEGIRWYGFKCSVCGFIRKGNAPRDANYCECCGARMVKDE